MARRRKKLSKASERLAKARAIRSQAEVAKIEVIEQILHFMQHNVDWPAQLETKQFSYMEKERSLADTLEEILRHPGDYSPIYKNIQTIFNLAINNCNRSVVLAIAFFCGDGSDLIDAALTSMTFLTDDISTSPTEKERQLHYIGWLVNIRPREVRKYVEEYDGVVTLPNYYLDPAVLEQPIKMNRVDVVRLLLASIRVLNDTKLSAIRSDEMRDLLFEPRKLAMLLESCDAFQEFLQDKLNEREDETDLKSASVKQQIAVLSELRDTLLNRAVCRDTSTQLKEFESMWNSEKCVCLTKKSDCAEQKKFNRTIYAICSLGIYAVYRSLRKGISITGFWKTRRKIFGEEITELSLATRLT